MRQHGPCYDTNIWPSFSNSRLSFSFSLKPSKKNKKKIVFLFAQFHKMGKHTQTIRRQIADELFECV